MVLIWSGWGVLTIPIVLATSAVVGGLLQAALTAAGQPDLTFLAFFAGGGQLVHRQAPERHAAARAADPRTNERVLLYRRHKLFWIPMQYWSIPVAIAALVPLLALSGT